MDLSVPDVDESVINLNTDCKEFYKDVVEEDSHQMPEYLGSSVYVGCFVGGKFITRHSHFGILLFVNNALINSFSKRQNTV